KIKKFLKNTKDDIFLIACQSVVVGYLVIGWYVTGKIIPDEKNILYLVILAVCIMPMIDIAMWRVLNLYADQIKKSENCRDK
ncbi:hypothetical protein, partial [Blautia sp. AF14-40]